jgi:hypothetical protein
MAIGEKRKVRSRVGYVVVASLVSACSAPHGQVDKDDPAPERRIADGFIAIDFQDSNYAGVAEYAKDTVTPGGWSITYFVKDDSTRFSDLYIGWSKGDRQGLFQCTSTLIMRRFFIPGYIGENGTHIFLQHGCSTSDEAMLVLSKDSLPRGQEVWVMFDYDLDLGQIAYVPERSFSLDTLEVSVTDFTRGLNRSVIFKNHCDLSPEYGCIDSVWFSEWRTQLFATLRDDAGGAVKETEVVAFNGSSETNSQH